MPRWLPRPRPSPVRTATPSAIASISPSPTTDAPEAVGTCSNSPSAGCARRPSSSSPRLVTTFERWAVPNAVIAAVHFTGTRYVQSDEYYASFRASDREVDVALTPDRARYAPGDAVTLDVRTRDRGGAPVAASVVLQAIDAKLFDIGAAADTDPLTELYSCIASGVRDPFRVTSPAATTGEGGTRAVAGADRDRLPGRPALRARRDGRRRSRPGDVPAVGRPDLVAGERRGHHRRSRGRHRVHRDPGRLALLRGCVDRARVPGRRPTVDPGPRLWPGARGRCRRADDRRLRQPRPGAADHPGESIRDGDGPDAETQPAAGTASRSRRRSGSGTSRHARQADAIVRRHRVAAGAHQDDVYRWHRCAARSPAARV